MTILEMIGRSNPLLQEDVERYESQLSSKVQNSSFLVIGGAGSIGQAVVKEIFKRNPKKLYVIDISENNLVELVRDLRSSLGYIDGDFKTFAIDCGSQEFEALVQAYGQFDYFLNLSALKHVRSEKDPFTLMRMIDVNIFNTIKTIQLAKTVGCKKYFCVSTDKAANPVNLMGASKRIMEMFLLRESNEIAISTARFANVAFSDGSLLHGFKQRIEKRQPISAPNDVRRYFVTPQEAGELCLMSTLLGENGDIFFPKLSEELNLITFSKIAESYLTSLGFEVDECSSEDEARAKAENAFQSKKWPCLFSASDTTGEKPFEEFFTKNEKVDMERFINLGIVKNSNKVDASLLQAFEDTIQMFKSQGKWTKEDVVAAFKELLPHLVHEEKNKNLDQKM